MMEMGHGDALVQQALCPLYCRMLGVLNKRLARLPRVNVRAVWLTLLCLFRIIRRGEHR